MLFARFAGGNVLRPPFLFSREKKETCRARCKEKRARSGFAMTRSLLLEKYLIIVDGANWSVVRMRLRISAAAKQTRKVSLFFVGKSSFLTESIALAKRQRFCTLRCQWTDVKTHLCLHPFGHRPQKRRELYESYSAPTGLARQTESRLPSFSSTPCTTLFFFFRREKKKRGVQKTVYRMWVQKKRAKKIKGPGHTLPCTADCSEGSV